jgi:hypothetical protein
MTDVASWSWGLLAVVQTLHLLHHRLARRHISLVEVGSSALLLVPPGAGLVPDLALATGHAAMAAIQVIGSIWIDRLSPDWSKLDRTAGEGRHS